MKNIMIFFAFPLCACGSQDDLNPWGECHYLIKGTETCIRSPNEEIIPTSERLNATFDLLDGEINKMFPDKIGVRELSQSYPTTITFVIGTTIEDDSYTHSSKMIVILVYENLKISSTLCFLSHELIHYFACSNNIDCSNNHPNNLFGTQANSLWSLTCSDLDQI